MTDRAASCSDSPDGRHYADNLIVNGQVVCRHCGAVNVDVDVSIGGIPTTGWNTPAHDPDAHLGHVGNE